MNLNDLKQKLSEGGFSAEVLAKLNEILDAAIAKGGLDDAARQQMMDLIDLDIESGQLEAETMENMALALNSLADEDEKILKMNEEAEAKIDADVNEEVGKVQDAVKLKQVRQQSSPAAPTM